MKKSTKNSSLMKGVLILAFSFPFLFAGPAFYFWIGAPALRQGNWGWTAFIVILMFVGAGLIIRGIVAILDGLFEEE
ncbi:MAG: Uncharacterised protein [Owenweeksia sp. TMED14]|nr:MAG: Uncharacterised protein [Owenweeksia sp. TMED14]|tara:strand:- start:197 stop:427 length:231 start_codon:yes stop_codon:yes gene_type:complete